MCLFPRKHWLLLWTKKDVTANKQMLINKYFSILLINTILNIINISLKLDAPNYIKEKLNT